MMNETDFVEERSAGVTGVGEPVTRSGPSLYGPSVEYGLHCVLWLLGDRPQRASSRDLAELQGVPHAMLAKIMPRLEKAGIVSSAGGITGGYSLGRPADEISVLDVVDAIEPGRKLFDCKEVRRGCVLFGDTPPAWSAAGVCGIHGVMLRAERRMRDELAKISLADLARTVRRPADFETLISHWFENRSAARENARLAAMKESRRKPS